MPQSRNQIPLGRTASLPHSELFPTAAYIVIETLEEAGHEAWFVGGCVRDAILHLRAADIDIATSASWQEVKDVCTAKHMLVQETGTKHGTVTVCLDGQRFEVTTYRVDGSYTDSRHPDAVNFVQSITEDLARRDFTMNAMAWHPSRGLCDPFGGMEDIAAKTMRTVGDGDVRFQEDALRILRGCRFVSQLGFSLADETARSMAANQNLLAAISAERVFAELDKLLAGPFAEKALRSCGGVLTAVIPEIAACIGFQQHNPHHRLDVWEHTAEAVGHAPNDSILRWALLFHDLGKPATFSCDDEGVGHFYGHAAVSERIARETMERLKAPKRYRQLVPLLVSYHDREIPPNEKAVKRLLVKLDGDQELFCTLLDHKRCDRRAGAAPWSEDCSDIDAAEALLEEILAQHEALCIADLAISGKDLIAKGLPQGPAVGAALQRGLDAVMDGTVANDADALLRFLNLDR